MRSLLAVALVLITEAGVVLSHVWARADHTHWAHGPWIDGLGIANWFHVASFASHWPIVAWVTLVHIPRGRYGWRWLGLAAASMLVWQLGKLAGGKAWAPWWWQVIEAMGG